MLEMKESVIESGFNHMRTKTLEICNSQRQNRKFERKCYNLYDFLEIGIFNLMYQDEMEKILGIRRFIRDAFYGTVLIGFSYI